MKTYIALFRGINVGGNNMLPMKALKALLEKNGCQEVRTYIQSGNVILSSSISDAAKLAKQLSAAVSKSHGSGNFSGGIIVFIKASDCTSWLLHSLGRLALWRQRSSAIGG